MYSLMTPLNVFTYKLYTMYMIKRLQIEILNDEIKLK